jgi:pyruvate, water dikinase
MTDGGEPVDAILRALQERAKELGCLYRVEEILASHDRPLDDVFRAVIETLPSGWQHPSVCQAKLVFRGQAVQPPAFVETPWVQSAPIVVQGEAVGSVSLYYTRAMPPADEGPFLSEERKLIDTIADRLAQFLLHRELTAVFARLGPEERPAERRQDWSIVVDLLRRTDPSLLRRISRKMLNYLSFYGIAEARQLLQSLSARPEAGAEAGPGREDENQPRPKGPAREMEALTGETFRIAAAHLAESEILSSIHVWIKEDRVSFLLSTLESSDSSLVDIAGVVERFQHSGVEASELSTATQAGIKVSLIRRLLTDHADLINVCRHHVEIEDFYDLLGHTIILPKSHGRLGGKASGLFLAEKIVRRSEALSDLRSNIRIPRTWYLPSDGILQFFAHNNLDDVYNWKYRDIEQIRQEYLHVVELFKSSRFPPEIVNGLSRILDDLGPRPLIVRSSSLLEDRMGSAFSGKYKSLFLANQGRKAERLTSLLDAVAEVYASVFSPDPIQYRAERGLIDQHEEMAIMIQEVVGARVGRYFLPAFSGVGLSHNELRWSPRIKRDDGLLRLVPGLGTRAVDRLSDDYPVLIAPGQPGLRVNTTPEEICRYSPKKVDVIDLDANSLETVDLGALLEEAGDEYPALERLVSRVDGDGVRPVGPLDVDVRRDQLVFTFDGLARSTPFVTQMRGLLGQLRDALGTPVDIEFASDGQDLFLLQCRPQSYPAEAAPAPIPRDLPESQVVFSAHRYVSNGAVPDLTHVVYVDPDGYGRLADLADLRDVGRAVGRLNDVLPKRQFALIGPGRWGSRGDIKLGVSVTYSQINNTALLVEVARKRGHYVPDLSFGTHFFQDLVEASIRYLPLYPDDPGVVFDEAFFRRSPSILAELVPELSHLAETVRVIDVPGTADGQVLRVLLNADLDEAVGILAPPGPLDGARVADRPPAPRPGEDHWRWRLRMAQRIAASLDPARFGVKAFYVFGSTKNATAGPGSDIDVIVHVAGDAETRRRLELWLEGWSLCLAEMNFLRTGYRTEGLLDVRIVTDDDVARQTSFAVKIGAVTDAARPLPLGPGAVED